MINKLMASSATSYDIRGVKLAGRIFIVGLNMVQFKRFKQCALFAATFAMVFYMGFTKRRP